MGTVDSSAPSKRSPSRNSCVAVPAQSDASRGGGFKALAARQRLSELLTSWRRSVWLPVATKATTVGAGMLALAAIGTVSTWQGAATQVSLDEPPPARAGALEGLWIPETQSTPSAASGSAAPSNTPPRSSTSAAPSAAPPKPSGVTADGRVILNMASVEELTQLPGIGTKRATAIVELRQRLGRFRRATDLLRVRGIGVRSLKKMLPHLVVDAPASAPTDNAEVPQ